MGKKKSLNAKRLTKKQVQELIDSEGKLHDEFTKFFEETYSTGYKEQPQIYELSKDRFLFVFDEKSGIGGKGDIYPKDYFLRMIRSRQRVRDDYANNRGNSVKHWRYYSKHKAKLVDKVDELVEELGEYLEISQSQLDFSYKSLDIISSQAENYGLEKVQAELYDNLIVYVGEVIKRRVDGRWTINSVYADDEYPCIEAKGNELMPINVVWVELQGLELMNLRKEAANEVRRFSLKYS